MGTRVDVLHLAATPVGRQVIAKAQVNKVDGRRIEFRIEASDGVAPIGSGTHERLVIDMQAFRRAAEPETRLASRSGTLAYSA